MPSERIQRRIDRLLDQVEEAADARDWERTRTLAQDILDLDSENPDAMTFVDVANRTFLGQWVQRIPTTLLQALMMSI